MNFRDLGFSGLLQRLILSPPTTDTTINSISDLGLMLNPATDIVFSSTDADTAAWATGNIYFSDGSISGQIAAGNTGTMTGVTFIYYDRNKPGALQHTSSHTNASGTTKFLVAIAEPGAAGKDCKIVPIIGAGLSVTGITTSQINFTPVESDEVIARINASAEGINIEADNIAISGSTTFSTGYNPTGYGKGFVSTLAWTATDYNTATWGSGSILTTDGTTYSIAAGNTGNIDALTYIYLAPATSVTVLQTTTAAATAAGVGKTLIAVVQLGASGSKCIIDVVGSIGTTIDGDRITTGKIQSSDASTYFDLDGDVIVISDASDPRIVIGEV